MGKRKNDRNSGRKTWKESNWEAFKRLASPILRNRKDASRLFWNAVLFAFSANVAPFAFRKSIEAFSSGDVPTAYAWASTILAASAVLAYHTFRILPAMPNFELGVSCELETEYLKKCVSMRQTHFDSVGSWRFASIIGNGCSRWTDWLSTFLWFFMVLSFSTIFGIANAFLVSWQAGVAFVVWVGAFFFGLSFYGKRLLAHRELAKEENVEYVRRFHRVLNSKTESAMSPGGFETDAAFLKGSRERELGHVLKAYVEVEKISVVSDFTMSSMKAFALVVVWGWAAAGWASLAGIATVVFVLWIMNDAFGRFSRIYRENFLKWWPHVKKLWETFDAAEYVPNWGTGNPFVPAGWLVEIVGATVSYGSKDALNGFSITFPAGKKTALVGLSGAGKTTVAKLVAGLAAPDSWKVVVDGQDLSETDLRSYGSSVAYLTQDPPVFDGTVRENLAYAKPDATDAEMETALRHAQCEFVFSFPKGMDTEIGDRGVSLSGGQKQRLAMAKVFLKDPEIVILDEPTSALDSFSEAKVSAAIHELFRDRTAIIIAHRLQTVMECDEIVVMADGKIVERGTHAELRKKEGSYRSMLDLQSGTFWG